MRLLIGIIAIAMYSGITFYLGWNLKKWLHRIEYFSFRTALLDCRFWYIIFLYFRAFPRTA